MAGTVLQIYSGKGNDSDDINVISPIRLGSSGGVRELSIFYPEQDASAPVPYPYTIRCKEKMQTVMNVTLVNSYKGIRYEQNNGLAVFHPYVNAVYGSPLNRGVRLNKAAAVPRLNSIYFDPSYWAESGLPGAPAAAEILTAQRSLASIGLEIEQSDNGIIGDLHLRGDDIGITVAAQRTEHHIEIRNDIPGQVCKQSIQEAQRKTAARIRRTR